MMIFALVQFHRKLYSVSKHKDTSILRLTKAMTGCYVVITVLSVAPSVLIPGVQI